MSKLYYENDRLFGMKISWGTCVLWSSTLNFPCKHTLPREEEEKGFRRGHKDRNNVGSNKFGLGPI